MRQYWRDKSLHQRTFALAVPMIVSNLTVPLTGLVDTAVIGHLDEAYYLGATAVGSLIITMIMWAMGFLRMSTTGLAAQAVGQESPFLIRQSLVNAVLLSLVLSLILLLVQQPLWQLAMHFMDASPQVKAYAEVYFDIRVWSIPAMLMRYVFIGWLLGMQSARGPLIILVVTNLVNMLLDVLFVVFWDWGVEGVAYASVIADYLGLLVGAFWVYRILRQHPTENTFRELLERKAAVRLLGLNRDIFIRTLALELVFFVQTSVGAGLGDTVLAANAVLMNFVMIMAYGLDGFANAVEAMSGKAWGEKQRDAFMGAISVTGLWSGLCSLLFVGVYAIAGEAIIGLMTDIPDVKKTASHYLIYLIGIPIISVWSYWLDGIFIGITRVKEMRNSMLIAVLFVFLPATYSVEWLGNHGLWLAFYAFMIARALGLGWYFFGLQKRLTA